MEVKDQWCDHYQVEVSTLNGKQVKELEVSATHVHYGKGYRIVVPPKGQDGFVKTYCIGPVKVVDGKAIILEKPEKPVTDIPVLPASPPPRRTTQRNIKVTPMKSTPLPTSAPVNVTTKTRSLRKELPEDEILNSNESGEALAKRFGVTRMTISRIRRGQRVLV